MRVLAVVVSSVTLVSFSSHAQEYSEIWGNDRVDAYIQANKPATNVEADPFAERPVPQPPAQRVRLTYLVTRADEGSPNQPISATWKYSIETQTLELTTMRSVGSSLLNIDWQGMAPAASYDHPKLHQAWLTFRSARENDAGEGQNAYGARVRMTRVMHSERGIAELGRGFRGVGPAGDQIVIKHSMQISPELGRALVPHLRLVVEAVTVQWRPNKWVICGSDYSGATVRNPTILISEGCYLTTEVQVIKFVDSRDGSVVHEWIR